MKTVLFNLGIEPIFIIIAKVHDEVIVHDTPAKRRQASSASSVAVDVGACRIVAVAMPAFERQLAGDQRQGVSTWSLSN